MALETAVAIHDPALPQLALALDAERMARFLPPHRDWRVAYLRYKPSTSCVVLYESRDGQWAYAKLFASDAAARIADRCSTYVPEHRLAVIAFPGDLAIRGLCALADETASRAMLERLARKRAGASLAERWGEWEPIRFKPERRAVLRGIHAQRYYYMRLYAGTDGERTAAWHKHLARAGGPAVPRRLAYSFTFRTLVLDQLEGEPLLGRLDAEAIAATAAALAAFHALPAPAGARPADGDEVIRSARVIDRLLPGCGALELAARLAATRPARGGACLLHGDFYYDQVLIAAGGEARFLDLDRLGIGDRHYDVANFCAHLIALSQPAWMRERFLAAYERAAGLRLCDAAYRWHLSAALLRLSDSPFRRFAPDWPDRVAALVEQARRPC